MQKLDLIALLAQFDAQQIAHREHAHPLFAVNNRQVTAADLFHSLQSLMGSLITINHGAQGTHHIAKLHRGWIAS